MDATKENENKLKRLFKRKNIKYIAVRENIDIFKYYMGKNSIIPVREVCDPGCWTKYIYNIEKSHNKKPVIGLNMVRGGLFPDNKVDYGLIRQFEFFKKVQKLLEEKGLDYIFYTNGSFLDTNGLNCFAKEYDIPEDKIKHVNTTKELVETIALCDKTISIRMHSSIISYALEIPSINLDWNDKLRRFYKNIGYPNRAIEIKDWNLETINDFINDNSKYQHSKEYLMSLYNYLYEIIGELFELKGRKKYEFDKVVDTLKQIPIDKEEDYLDMELKLQRAKNNYYHRYHEINSMKKEISNLEKTNNELKDKTKALEKDKKELKTKLDIVQKKYDNLSNKFIIKLGRKINRFIRKILNNKNN